jgi:predicted outer membrane protein
VALQKAHAKHQATIDRLSALSGSNFDSAYMQEMVMDHEADMAAFQHEANAGMNADLKNRLIRHFSGFQIMGRCKTETCTPGFWVSESRGAWIASACS